MRPFNRQRLEGSNKTLKSQCIFCTPHQIGGHCVLTTINVTDDSIEVKCIEPRDHQEWNVQISFTQVAAILLRLTEELDEKVSVVWDFIAHSPELDIVYSSDTKEEKEEEVVHHEPILLCDTQHIVYFEKILSSELLPAYRLYEVNIL